LFLVGYPQPQRQYSLLAKWLKLTYLVLTYRKTPPVNQSQQISQSIMSIMMLQTVVSLKLGLWLAKKLLDWTQTCSYWSNTLTLASLCITCFRMVAYHNGKKNTWCRKISLQWSKSLNSLTSSPDVVLPTWKCSWMFWTTLVINPFLIGSEKQEVCNVVHFFGVNFW